MNDDTNKLCELLEDYLDGELSADARGRFDAHLNQCAACREAVDEQQWIESLLQSEEAAEIETPAVVVFRTRPRRRWLVAAAAAAAASVTIVAACSLVLRTRTEGVGERPSTVASAPLANPSPTTDLRSIATGDRAPLLPSLPGRGILDPPVAEFVSSGGAIAIPVASADPQVTIVKLYPTVTASRRWAREAALRRNSLSPNGG
jgi:anti-sigma factor RsiW